MSKPHLRFKDGTWVPHWHRDYVERLPTILDCFDEFGLTPVVTEVYATTGHMVGSKHYNDPCEAADWRTWTTPTSGMQISESVRGELVRLLRQRLGRKFDVVGEPTHIHIELA